MSHPYQHSLEISRLVLPTRILVATGLTDQERLLPYVLAQGHATGARITLVHAIQPEVPPFTEGGGFHFVPDANSEPTAAVSLAAMARKIEAENLSCTTVLGRGFAVDIVQEQIEATGATRLIMGSHGRGKLGQFVLGSVANQLLGRVAIPIFLAGPHAAPTSGHCTPRRILHPVPMNADYRPSVEIARRLGEFYGAEVTMLHVMDRDMERTLNADYALSWAEKLFAELAPDSDQTRSSIKVSVAFGERIEQIRKEAARIQADWIVVGVEEGISLWPLRESIAYRVLKVAECPVIAIRHRAWNAHSEAKQISVSQPDHYHSPEKICLQNEAESCCACAGSSSSRPCK